MRCSSTLVLGADQTSNGDGTVRAPEQRRVSRRFGLAKAELHPSAPV